MQNAAARSSLPSSEVLFCKSLDVELGGVSGDLVGSNPRTLCLAKEEPCLVFRVKR